MNCLPELYHSKWRNAMGEMQDIWMDRQNNFAVSCIFACPMTQATN